MTVATLEELGELVQGTIRGQANIPIRFALPLNDTLPADCITLVDRVNAASALVDSAAAAAIVPAGFPATDKPVIEVTQPHAAFERIIEHLRPHGIRLGTGVDEHAFVHPTARLGRGCIIEAGACVGAHCVLGDRVVLHSGVHIMASSTLGDDCEIFPGAIIYPETQIGSRVVIHGAAVLGAYGFGYKTINGRHARSAQLGWVEIADDVEIGAGVTIDRGTYGATRVGQGTKIDNQVMIGHNCQIGQHNLICAQVGIAGSCSTGDYVVLAGQVGIKDHTHVGNRVMVAAQSGVMHDIADGEVYSGVPAIPIKKHLHQVALQARLPDIRREIRDLETLSASLQQQLADVQSQIDRVTSSNSEQRAA